MKPQVDVNDTRTPEQRGWYPLGNHLWVAEVMPEELKEQAINAQAMPPQEFERLVTNIKDRGKLESLPYCSQPNAVGPIDIVSGHHRNRAAKAAGLKTIHVLVDTLPHPRSKLIAKQLAHNQLVGQPVTDVVKQLLGMIDNPDDLLHSGVPKDFMADLRTDSMILFTPSISIAWKVMSFMVLPHQLENVDKAIKALEGPQDLVVAMHDSQWLPFLQAATKVARIKGIKAGGSVIAYLTEIALKEIEAHELNTIAKEMTDGQSATVPAAGS